MLVDVFTFPTLARVGLFVYPRSRRSDETMLKTINTSTFAEAAQVVSAPCRRESVADGMRRGNVLSLAERCAR